jgi:hypothetical protein
MSALIFIGSINILFGILLLISAKQHDFEVKEYNKIAKKDAPKNIGIITYIIGGILSIIGLISLFLGFTSAPSQIVGMPLKSKFV